MKYLIVGLGNIGTEYEHTRHNIGFDIIDILCKQHNAAFSLDRHAFVTSFRLKSKNLIVIKPTTYMNLSGKAVKYWMDAEKIEIENVLIVLDDLSIPLGKLKMKLKGGDGNHNGLTSIIQSLNTAEFCRLRFGIGSDFKRGFQSDFVLGKWKPEEEKELSERIDLACEMIKTFCLAGPQLAMTGFNNK